MDAASLSRRLKAARELAGGITVNQLADLVNKPRFGSKVIGAIERGERQAADHELDWLSEALCVPVAFLTDDEPFAGQGGTVEERLALLSSQIAHDRRERDDNITDVKALLEQQNALLARQSKILDGIENLLATQLSAARQMEDAATELRSATARRQSPPRTSPRASSSKS